MSEKSPFRQLTADWMHGSVSGVLRQVTNQRCEADLSFLIEQGRCFRSRWLGASGFPQRYGCLAAAIVTQWPHMAFADPKMVNFSLRGRRIDDLRMLGGQYLPDSYSKIVGMSKTELVSQLSEAAANSKELSKELRKGSISLKPSFYLMRFSDEPKVKLQAAKTRLDKYLQQHSVGLTNLKVQLVDELKDGLFQIVFTWESSFNYWAPTFEMAQAEELQFGLSVLDYSVRKG